MPGFARRQGWLWLLGLGLLFLVDAQHRETGGTSTRQLRRHRKEPPKEAVQGWGCYEQLSVLPSFNESRFPFCKVLEEGKVIFYWSHDHQKEGPSPRNVTMGVVAHVSPQEAEWIALGLSDEASGMRGMDVAMFWTQEGLLEDRWSADYSMPVLDEEGGQDKQLLEWVVKPTLPLIAFAFALPVEPPCPAEGKATQDVVISERHKTFVAWAHGKGSPATTAVKDSGLASRVPTFHGPDGRGQGIALPLLLNSSEWSREKNPVFVPKQSQEVTIALPGTTPVPHTRSTTYQCMWVRPPADPRHNKFHIYRTQLVGKEEVQRQVVHHAILYGVDSDTLPPGVPGFDIPYECEHTLPEHYGLPLLVSSHAALASPSDQAYAGVDAALPFGTNSSNRLWVLEVHYENKDRIEGLTDTTGFKLTYSPILRTHDAGVLVTGAMPSLPLLNLTSSLSIPPQKLHHHHWDLCPAECLSRHLPPPEKSEASNNASAKGGHNDADNATWAAGGPGGAVLLYSRLHMHMLGTGGEIRVEHADGSADVVLRREYWDFNHQMGRSYSTPSEGGKETRIKAGDRLLVRCSYDAAGRSNVTRWGPSAQDEMCLAYLFLAPLPRGDATCFNLQGASNPTLDYFSHPQKPAGKGNQTAQAVASVKEGKAAAASPTSADEQERASVNPDDGLKLAMCMTLAQHSSLMASPGTFAHEALKQGLFVGHSPKDVASLQELKRATAANGDGGLRGEACANP